MRTVLSLGCVLVCLRGLAMPKPEEIKKAQPLVVELMSEDLAALQKGDKTAVDVGDAALDYANAAESEAAKYVLYKGALQYFVRGKDYDKAAEAVELLRTAIKDFPPEEVVEIIRGAARGVSGKDAPRLLAILKDARLQIDVRKGIAAAKRALSRKSTDMSARQELAEWYAVGGDWDNALEAFAACGGAMKKNTENEAEKKDLLAVADFWWAYRPNAVLKDDAFKAHAADIYRTCIADGVIDGLKKEVVVKRLKSVDAVVSALPREKVPVPGSVKELELPGGAKMKFAWCPPGTFLMGSSLGDKYRNNNEKQHKVTLTKGFWMGQCEVTQAQWQSVMGGNPSHFRGGDLPVEQVSWFACQEFVAKCNAEAKGIKFALPTEAQWEYACRAGTTRYDADTVEKYAWTTDNAEAKTHPVGQKQSNRWNLYDMLGNVWEWCSDWEGEYEGDCTDPTGASSGKSRVLRGGSWCRGKELCRPTCRNSNTPNTKIYHYGFRLCCFEEPGE